LIPKRKGFFLASLKCALYHNRINNLELYFHTVVAFPSSKQALPTTKRATVTTEDLLFECMAKVNNALSLEYDALRLRAARKAKHWAEDEYAKRQPLPAIEVNG
jgi:hypothetical protein